MPRTDSWLRGESRFDLFGTAISRQSSDGSETSGRPTCTRGALSRPPDVRAFGQSELDEPLELDELAGLLSLLAAVLLLLDDESLVLDDESLLPPPSPLLAPLSAFDSWPAPFGPRFFEP